MKRLLTIIGCILLLVSCSMKEPLDNSSVTEGKQVTIRVNVSESPFSKVGFTADGNKLKIAWEESDCLRVISGENSEVFTISNIISDHEAEFTGTEVTGTSFDILFPGTYPSVEAAEADLVSPTQTGNGTTTHLKYRALLSGVDTYEEIQFRSDWATTHGGTLKQAPAVKLQATLPAGVTNVKKAGVILGGENYTVPLSGVDVSESSQTLTAYLMLPWVDIPLASGTKIPVYALDADNEAYGTTLTISGEDKAILQGKLNTLANLSLSLQDFVAGDGSASNPYLIANARQLDNMHNVDGSSNCFRLLEDVDAASIDNWAPLNAAPDFSKAMDFDGDGHTISNLKSSGATYASFSGVLNGHIHDVTFDNATVSHTSKVGVVGGFIGTTGVVGNCTDVHVTNSTVSGSSNWCGGFAAEINTTGTLLRCSVENTSVTATGHVGEFAGIVRAQKATLKDCYTKNVNLTRENTPSGIQGLGGFLGCATIDAIFDHCYVEGPVTLASTVAHDKTNKVAVGGFIGYITPSGVPTFNDCYVEGSDVEVVNISGNSEVGGFVGNSDKSAAYNRCRVSGITVSGTNYLGGFLGLGQVSGGYEVPAIFTECEVEDVTVTQNYASNSGSIHTGGFAGTTAQALSFIDCSVSGTTVTATKAAVQNVGGFIGCTTGSGANFQGCTVDSSTSVSGKANSVGGFVGWAYVPDAYKSCSSAASVNNNGSYTGGFVGHATASSSYTDCYAAGNVTSSGAYTGGFVGYCESSSYFGCHYDDGIVKNTRSNNNTQVGGFVGGSTNSINFTGCYVSSAAIVASSAGRTGGFAGQIGGTSGGGNNISVTQCYVTDTNVDGAINTGGFVGVQYADIAKSYVDGGTVTAQDNQAGGFSAFIQNSNISDCYTTATVNGGSYSDVGGFAGHIYDNSSIRNSYSSGTQNGTGANRSAFIAVCQRATAAVSNCIGWHATLPFYASNTIGATITNGYAGTEGTVSAQAALQQGWSADVWNLDGPLPLLKPGSSRIPAVFIGDSITWQWARVSRSDAQSTIIEATHGVLGNSPLPSYMTLSGSNITTKFHPEFFSSNGYIDKGISGQNTTQMRARFQKDVIALNPKAFVIMGGTNDIAQGTSEDDIFANVAYMASEAKAAGIKVIICSITPNNREYGGGVGWKSVHIEALNSRYKELCDSEGYTYCDYWNSLVARNSGEAAVSTDIDHGLKDGYKLYDDLHPGPDAYTVMEGIIKPIIDGI